MITYDIVTLNCEDTENPSYIELTVYIKGRKLEISYYNTLNELEKRLKTLRQCGATDNEA